MKKVYFKSLHKLFPFHEPILTIQFENPIIFRNLHYTLEEELEFSDENSLLVFDSSVYILSDIFELSLKDKKIVNALYKKLENSISTVVEEKIIDMKHQFVNILEDLSMNLDFSIQYNEDFSFSKVLSLFQVDFEEFDKKNYLEHLVSFFKIVSELLNLDLFISFGISTHLTKEEYIRLKKELSIQNIYILDLCYTPIIHQKNSLLVDSDWCII